MNKRGAVFFGIAVGIFLFAMGVLILPFLQDSVTSFEAGMDCDGASISDGGKIVCLLADGTIPYYIWFFTSMALGLFIGSRI